MRAPAIKLPAPALNQDQRAALDRAKRPRRHPYRIHQASGQALRDAAERLERIAPGMHRLVR
ncbi:hypothetical protein BCL79_1878 [Stenotrophomonas rhizophila]|uniref:Uncharacterized protein n=1 Tax=Stenotrophomonas rhizophila TaxID=216778 RepID=A0A498CV77_9GAMM|nr:MULTISPECIES: hypothetical protein [Stenotrophomonas]RLK57472.1 hypothetical protein BCL79_1878 [Stenotrophomonas rhizophila]